MHEVNIMHTAVIIMFHVYNQMWSFLKECGDGHFSLIFRVWSAISRSCRSSRKIGNLELFCERPQVVMFWPFFVIIFWRYFQSFKKLWKYDHPVSKRDIFFFTARRNISVHFRFVGFEITPGPDVGL